MVPVHKIYISSLSKSSILFVLLVDKLVDSSDRWKQPWPGSAITSGGRQLISVTRICWLFSGLPQLRGHLHPGHLHRPGRHHHRGNLHPGHLHRPGRHHLRGYHHLDYVNAVNPHSIEDLHVSSQNWNKCLDWKNLNKTSINCQNSRLLAVSTIGVTTLI